MTRAIYEKLTRQARLRVQSLPYSVMKAQRTKIIESANELAEVVKTLSVEDLPSATKSNLAILKAMDNGSIRIAESLHDNVLVSVTKTIDIGSSVNREFMIDAGFSSSRVDGVLLETNRKLLATTINRTYSDGYNFSTRIWKVGQQTQNDIKKVLDMGIASNRDPFEIAKDIQVYARDGKVKLMDRYGQLQRGSTEFALRIPENVDYRAMRIVKTEMYSSLRDTEIMSGESNPGTTGMYRWVLNLGRGNWECECPDFANSGPYPAEGIPSNPHPNCSCYIQAVLRDQNEFVEDLKRWRNGESVDYLDEWASTYNY